jgi:hypothetical protein
MTRSNSSRRRSAASGGMLRAAWTRGAHLLAAISLQLALNPPCSAASLTLPTTAIGMVRTGISFAKTPLTFAADLDAHETSSTRSRSRRTFSSISTSPTCAPRRRPPDIIRAKAHGRIAIRGYTDALGKDAYNQRLSSSAPHRSRHRLRVTSSWPPRVSRHPVPGRAIRSRHSRSVVDFEQRRGLLNHPVFHHHDRVAHRHRFRLAMRDIDCGNGDFLIHLGEEAPRLDTSELCSALNSPYGLYPYLQRP